MLFYKTYNASARVYSSFVFVAVNELYLLSLSLYLLLDIVCIPDIIDPLSVWPAAPANKG